MIIIIIILLLIIALEVFLSLQDNKYLGLILPVATILLALAVFFGKMINTSILIAAFAFLLFSVWLIVKHILKIKKRKKNRHDENKRFIKNRGKISPVFSYMD